MRSQLIMCRKYCVTAEIVTHTHTHKKNAKGKKNSRNNPASNQLWSMEFHVHCKMCKYIYLLFYLPIVLFAFCAYKVLESGWTNAFAGCGFV